MKDFDLIQSLIGTGVTENELQYVDCYVHKNLGLFIPSMGKCGYAAKIGHTHPSYMFAVIFSQDGLEDESQIREPEIEIRQNHYLAAALSPEIPHTDFSSDLLHYYGILIEKNYFESQYKMYTNERPDFFWRQFALCADILKTLNSFAFEYSKNMTNADVTLSAQVTLITHWIIRSLLGENSDVRSISSNYVMARLQHYIEQHFGEPLTQTTLAQAAHLSKSSLNRLFHRELGVSPMEYLAEVRIEKSKVLLRRKEISITETAARCGFGSSAYFAACFRKITGKTPSEYREKYRG